MSNISQPKAAADPKLLPFGVITLRANLLTVLGEAVENGYVRVTLCGFGPLLPRIIGTGMLADAGIPMIVGPQPDALDPILINLPINAVIYPPNTFYEIAILDKNQNVIQAGNYLLSGTGTIDLDDLDPIDEPLGYQLGGLRYAPCTGAIPGSVYVAPGTIIALSYNGVFLREGQSLPFISFTKVGEVATLNFTTQIGDRVDAICVVLP